MIIGLSGIQGAGKDTVGEILISEYGFVKLSFGSTLELEYLEYLEYLEDK